MFNFSLLGEGIHDTYLKNYHRNEATVEFQKFHYTNEPDDWLDKAIKLKFDSETGIRYIGIMLFKKGKRLPIFLHNFQTQTEAEKYLEESDPKKKSFTLYYLPDHEDQLNLVFQDEGKYSSAIISKTENKFKATGLSAECDTVEEIIEAIAISKGHEGI